MSGPLAIDLFAGLGGWGVAQYTGSKSKARKAASAQIAKIPLVLARHIASVYKPLDRRI